MLCTHFLPQLPFFSPLLHDLSNSLLGFCAFQALLNSVPSEDFNIYNLLQFIYVNQPMSQHRSLTVFSLQQENQLYVSYFFPSLSLIYMRTSLTPWHLSSILLDMTLWWTCFKDLVMLYWLHSPCPPASTPSKKKTVIIYQAQIYFDKSVRFLSPVHGIYLCLLKTLFLKAW